MQYYRKFYLISLVAVLLVCAYPVYMGAAILYSYVQNGLVDASNYQKYVIPYTPVCLAIVLNAAIMPLLYRRFRRHSGWIASLLGAAVFLLFEVALEQILVTDGGQALPIAAWQYSLCVATPQVLRSIGLPLYAGANPVYKVHFYLIALVIVLTVTHLVYGYTKMIKEGDRQRKLPLALELVCVLVFIGLCILACFTAFYRNGTLFISPRSAVLMSVFFVVFGVTVGAYSGCLFYKKNIALSIILPAVLACATTLAMYMGELSLTGGILYRLGKGVLFHPLGSLPFSAADIVIILASGGITFILLRWINRIKPVPKA